MLCVWRSRYREFDVSEMNTLATISSNISNISLGSCMHSPGNLHTEQQKQ